MLVRGTIDGTVSSIPITVVVFFLFFYSRKDLLTHMCTSITVIVTPVTTRSSRLKAASKRYISLTIQSFYLFIYYAKKGAHPSAGMFHDGLRGSVETLAPSVKWDYVK